jgi:hypothetical protein
MTRLQSLLWLFLLGPILTVAGMLLLMPVMLPPALRFRLRPLAIILIVVGAAVFVGGVAMMVAMPQIVVRRR